MKVVVNLQDGSAYDVRIGTDLLDNLGYHLRSLHALSKANRLVVISDSNVGPLYLLRVKAALGRAGYSVSQITLPAGETTKSTEVLAELWEAFAQLKLTRHDAAIALGGGVVGDITGFAAATYMRGIPFVQVPTSLLAAVDASVGGKTAVNLPQGKNLVGAFHQPAYVACDVDALGTLPQEQWACGLAEVVKTALISGDDNLFWLEEHADEVREVAQVADHKEIVREMIARAVVAKADVVGQDPLETTGVREALNYGHTFGHALEKEAGLGTLTHGHAVAQGMRLAAWLSVKLCGLDEGVVAAQNELLDRLGLPAIDLSEFSGEAFVEAMSVDKKNVGGQIRFVLLEDVGRIKTMAVSADDIREGIRAVFGV